MRGNMILDCKELRCGDREWKKVAGYCVSLRATILTVLNLRVVTTKIVM
jgi:hypothetical protein